MLRRLVMAAVLRDDTGFDLEASSMLRACSDPRHAAAQREKQNWPDGHEKVGLSYLSYHSHRYIRLPGLRAASNIV